MNAPWSAAFGPAESTARCGDQQHRLRWEAGRLTALDHPDAEGELVLGTLGGGQPECIRLLRTWGDHSDDLDVLMLGPRSATDTLTIDARDAGQLRAGPAGWSAGWPAGPPLAGPAPGRALPGLPLTWGSLWSASLRSFVVNARGLPRGRASYGPGQAARLYPIRAAQASRLTTRRVPSGVGPDLDREAARRAGLLELLALGRAFQFRLCATVAAAWSQRDPGSSRPALAAAVAGRVAPAVACWLGTDADGVRVSLAAGPGGLAQDGDGWRAGLSWVAAVWAAGLALVDGHLVLDLTAADYPRAEVLALEKPGSGPAALTVQRESAPGSSRGPRWRIIRS